jgi:hypothetical protein
MHSIKLLLFSLALLCWQTATSHTLQTNLQAVSRDTPFSLEKTIFGQEVRSGQGKDVIGSQLPVMESGHKDRPTLPFSSFVTPPQISKYC